MIGLNKKGEYKYKFIRIDKKGQKQIQIQVYRLVFENTNINMTSPHTMIIAHMQ